MFRKFLLEVCLSEQMASAAPLPGGLSRVWGGTGHWCFLCGMTSVKALPVVFTGCAGNWARTQHQPLMCHSRGLKSWPAAFCWPGLAMGTEVFCSRWHPCSHSQRLFVGCGGHWGDSDRSPPHKALPVVVYRVCRAMGDEPLAPHVAPRGSQPGGFLSG